MNMIDVVLGLTILSFIISTTMLFSIKGTYLVLRVPKDVIHNNRFLINLEAISFVSGLTTISVLLLKFEVIPKSWLTFG